MGAVLQLAILASFLGGTGVPGSTGSQPVPGGTGVSPVSADLGGTSAPPVIPADTGGTPVPPRSSSLTPPPDARRLPYPNFEDIPYIIESGLLDNDTDEHAVVFSHEVHLPGAAWLRLFYDRATLVGDSRVRVTSLRDGDVQELNAGILKQWSNTSAYFNGDRVLLELLAAPRTQGNEINLEKLRKQGRRPPDDDAQITSICGTDDRVASYEDWAGRIIGSESCSGAIITTSSAMIGAGHCVDPQQVMQFRVPPSVFNGFYCEVMHPPADDQFPVLDGQHNSNGLGDDWWVALVGRNDLGERPFDRYGQLRHVATNDAPAGAFTEAVGYGGDPFNCPDHLTQQLSPGALLETTATYYRFNNDITGGNSGSGYLFNNRIIGVVAQQSSCSIGSFSTKASNVDFVAARQAVTGACITDQTGDGVTDQLDLARLLAAYNTIAGDASYDYISDMDDDDLVGQSDLALLLSEYGNTCGVVP